MTLPIGRSPYENLKFAKVAADHAARGLTIGAPQVKTDLDQKPIFGYRLAATFSHAEPGRHKIYRKGEIFKDAALVQKLAAHGARFDILEVAPETEKTSDGAGDGDGGAKGTADGTKSRLELKPRG